MKQWGALLTIPRSYRTKLPSQIPSMNLRYYRMVLEELNLGSGLPLKTQPVES